MSIFRIVTRIDRHGISKRIICHSNIHGNFSRVPLAHFQQEMEMINDQKQLRKPIELFKKPFVMELMSARFDRPIDTNYWSCGSVARSMVSDNIAARNLQHPAPTPTEDSQIHSRWSHETMSSTPQAFQPLQGPGAEKFHVFGQGGHWPHRRAGTRTWRLNQDWLADNSPRYQYDRIDCAS